MKTRITFLIRDLGFAGAQRQLVALASGLDHSMLDVTVISFYGGPLADELRTNGVPCITIGKKGRWDMFGFLWRILKALRASQPDILHTYLNESNLLGALLKPFLQRAKLVWGLRDSQTDAALFGWLGKLVFSLAKRLSHVPDLLIANSQSGADYYIAQGYPAARITVIPNGIDVQRFQPDSSKRATLRAEWGIPEGAFLFGLIGRISPMKDQLTALRALTKLPAHVHLLVMGKGDEGYLAEIKALATDRVHFSAPRSDMPAVYGALDALLNSSAFGEGFSNVIGEAMACGLHCVGTQVGDTAMLIGETGSTAPPSNPEALAQAMHQVLAGNPHDPRARIESQFTIPCMIRATAAALTRKSIAIYTTGLGSGGAEMMLTQILSKLDRTKFRPHVISLTEGGKYVETLRSLNIPVHSLGMKAGIPSLRSFLKLRSLAKEIRPALNIGWMYHGNLVACLAGGAPVIWNVRQSLYDLRLEKRGSALVIKALAWLSWMPRRIIYNSKISSQQHEGIGYRRDRTQLTANGFDPERFKPDPDARTSVRSELGLPPDAILIGRFGRNAAMKDYPTLLAAAELLPDLHFIIAGTDTDQIQSPKSKIQNLHALGERHDLPRLTAALDIAVSSSAFGEGFPNVIAEAMCCAVPVIATDIGDSAWVIGDCGRLVPPRDPQALANAIRDTLADPDRHLQSAAARQRIVDTFSLNAAVQGFESALHHSPDIPIPSSLIPKSPCAA